MSVERIIIAVPQSYPNCIQARCSFDNFKDLINAFFDVLLGQNLEYAKQNRFTYFWAIDPVLLHVRLPPDILFHRSADSHGGLAQWVMSYSSCKSG